MEILDEKLKELEKKYTEEYEYNSIQIVGFLIINCENLDLESESWQTGKLHREVVSSKSNLYRTLHKLEFWLNQKSKYPEDELFKKYHKIEELLFIINDFMLFTDQYEPFFDDGDLVKLRYLISKLEEYTNKIEIIFTELKNTFFEK